MAVTIEEVSAEISPTQPSSTPAPAAAAQPDAAQLAAQIEQSLRLRAEREARLCDR